MKTGITFYFYGNPPQGLNEFINRIDIQRIILDAQGKSKKSKASILKSSIDSSTTKCSIKQLEMLGLIKNQNNEFVPSIIILTNENKPPFIKLGRKLASKLALEVRQTLPILKEIYKGTKVYQNGFTWEKSLYQVVCGLLIDIGINESLCKAGFIKRMHRKVHATNESYDATSYYLYGIQGGTGASRHFGVNRVHFESFTLANIWSHNVKDSNLRISGIDALLFKLICERKTSHSLFSIAPLMDRLHFHLKKGLVKKAEGKVKVNFPIFDTNDTLSITRFTQVTCNKILKKIIYPELKTIRNLCEKFRDVPAANEIGFILINRIMMDYCLDYLVENFAFPDMPISATNGWGFWGMEV